MLSGVRSFMKGNWDACAIVAASAVLPDPGGPCSNTLTRGVRVDVRTCSTKSSPERRMSRKTSACAHLNASSLQSSEDADRTLRRRFSTALDDLGASTYQARTNPPTPTDRIRRPENLSQVRAKRCLRRKKMPDRPTAHARSRLQEPAPWSRYVDTSTATRSTPSWVSTWIELN